MSPLRKSILSLVALALGGCLGYPENIRPVQNFEIEKYLGTWYEIARLDHSFERGLENVSASYSLRDDGGIDVLNRGFNPAKGEWEQAEGKAYFARESDEAYLKVSFFGPFYSSYVVYQLDDDYQQAYVTGPDRSYLWFLSRSTDVSEQALHDFVNRADALGYATDELIYVEHGQTAPPP